MFKLEVSLENHEKNRFGDLTNVVLAVSDKQVTAFGQAIAQANHPGVPVADLHVTDTELMMVCKRSEYEELLNLRKEIARLGHEYEAERVVNQVLSEDLVLQRRNLEEQRRLNNTLVDELSYARRVPEVMRSGPGSTCSGIFAKELNARRALDPHVLDCIRVAENEDLEVKATEALRQSGYFPIEPNERTGSGAPVTGLYNAVVRSRTDILDEAPAQVRFVDTSPEYVQEQEFNDRTTIGAIHQDERSMPASILNHKLPPFVLEEVLALGGAGMLALEVLWQAIVELQEIEESRRITEAELLRSVGG